MRLVFCFILFLAFTVQAGFGRDVPVGKIVDDSALRNSVLDTWLLESPAKVLAKPKAQFELRGGGKIELRVENLPNEFMIVFARERAAFASGAVTSGATASGAITSGASANGAPAGRFPVWSQGSWILTRRKDTGAGTRIRVFLRNDQFTYVQFRPFNADKCLMDVVLYDAFIVRSLTLPVAFERLYTMPLSEVLDLAGDSFPKKYFEPEPANYRDHRLLIKKIRERLPELQFADDGAIDHAGRYVYINTGLAQRGRPGLNCSGFTKWLIDGILRPVTGERLAIPPLKAPFGDRGSSVTEPWEELRDPFFGLDWIRNLASQAGSTLYDPVFGGMNEIVVRQEPFSQVILRGKNSSIIHAYSGFLENAGYGVEGLMPLLYTLAIDEPDKFFLAAVNDEISAPAPGTRTRTPVPMRQYFHVMAFIPYFSENGVFQIAVFESAAETSFNAFRNRYPVQERVVSGERRVLPNGHCVSLVRVPVESRFDP